MKQIWKLVVFGLLALQLSACVEMKDADKDDDPAPIEAPVPAPIVVENVPVVTHSTEFVVDQPMFIYKGKVVNNEQLRELQFVKQEVMDWSPHNVVLNYDKVTFTAAGVLSILDNTVTLNAAELVATKGARIETFPAGAVAAPAAIGHNGGTLTMSIGKATGDLDIILRGEKGGPGAGGRDSDAVEKLTYCSQTNGYQGGPGGAGGNSGKLLARISEFDPIAFQINLQRIEGAGGEPGGGGRGFAQLNAGNHPEGKMLCAVDGRGGGQMSYEPTGNGPDGARGAAGQRLKSTIYRGPADRQDFEN